MNNKERELVNKEFVNRKDTYNLNEGGTGSWYACNKAGLNNKSNQYLIEYERCLKDENYKKEHCEKISVGVKTYKKLHPEYQVGENNNMFGKKHTKEARKKMTESHLGERNTMFNKIWITNPKLKENSRKRKTYS